jgi:hypothetical protein
MNWIEILFGISPDGNDGTLETVLLLLLTIGIMLLLLRRVLRTIGSSRQIGCQVQINRPRRSRV